MFSTNKIIMLIVSLALFMEALDTTIINTAIPTMALSLHVNPIDLKIALISYLISLAIIIPISGWIADRFGVKRVFITAVAIFTASSLWCGYADSLLGLIIARTLQGIGGALTLPIGRLILLRSFPRNKVFMIMGRVVMVGAMGMMLGPVLGGTITHYFSWRWIFWVNIPVGLLAIFLAKIWLTDMPAEKVPPLDKLGFILFGGSLALFTFGLSAFSESTLDIKYALTIVISAIVLFILYVTHSYRHPHPVVKTELFRLHSFQVATVGSLISRLGMGGIPFLLPILLQIGLNYSVQEAGFLLAPLALGVVLIKPFAVRLLRQFGYRRLLILNTTLVAFSMWSFSLLNTHTSVYLIILLVFLFGFLTSMQYSSMNSLSYAEISPRQLSAANSIVSTLQQLAQSFGVAISALLIHGFSQGSGKAFALTPIIFHHTFLAMGVVTLFSTLIFWRLHPEDGRQMIEDKELS